MLDIPTCEIIICTLQPILGLEDWEIEVRNKSLSEDTMAEATVYGEYRNARIDVDLECHADRKSLATTLRHEMLHMLHAHIGLYRMCVAGVVKGPKWDMLENTIEYGLEELVTQIELILDRAGVADPMNL